jgi:2-polyprenyl-6-methoxyphenol hydroxylase-like FAD-dependent oxidoreductase
MSPIGGVGINLAVQDAVATANRLAAPLAAGRVGEADLQAIQRRRATAAQRTQAVQLFMQNRIIGPALQATRTPKPPLMFKLLDRMPLLRRLPARLIAVGFRPEHIETPAAQ